jgi:hypothetical protein
MLEIETLTFEQKLPELVKTDKEKYVLIKGDQIIGTYTALSDALKFGYEKFRDQSFFVRQIFATPQPLNFANNYLFS